MVCAKENGLFETVSPAIFCFGEAGAVDVTAGVGKGVPTGGETFVTAKGWPSGSCDSGLAERASRAGKSLSGTLWTCLIASEKVILPPSLIIQILRSRCSWGHVGEFAP